MFARLFYSQLPPWARPSYPIMRYALGYRSGKRSTAFLRAGLLIVVAALVVGAAYFYTQHNTHQDSPPYREVMYYPIIFATLLMQILALAISSNSIALERQRGTWESLQVTLVGASMTMRTRWALVFYRVRWLLLGVFIARLVYIAALLYDMTDFEGRAIDVRIIGISPEVSLEVAVVLLAALMTAAILQPFMAVAFDSALGLLVATLTRRRDAGILTTVTLMATRVMITVASVILGGQILGPDGTTARIISMQDGEIWARLLALTTQGDLSLRLLSLEAQGTIWADVSNGIYLGALILAWVVLQAVLIQGILWFTTRQSSRASRN